MLPDFLSKDALELLELLSKHKVEYLLVGGVAVNYYGYTRSTGDLDIFFRIEEKNAEHLFKALKVSEEFEVPLIDLNSLIENKKHANRPKDQEDFQYLKALKDKKKGNS